MKQILSIEQLHAFVPVVRGLFAHVDAVNASLPPGLHIKGLQVPAVLTESLALHLLTSGVLGRQLTVRPSRSGGDLEIVTDSGGRARLEVKGTGPKGFQSIGPKDRAAAVLLWLHYDDFFSRPEKESVTVHLLGKPGAVLPSRNRMSIVEFLALPGVISAEPNLVEFLGLPRATPTSSVGT